MNRREVHQFNPFPLFFPFLPQDQPMAGIGEETRFSESRERPFRLMGRWGLIKVNTRAIQFPTIRCP
jgi:hypothetical protein